MNATAWLHRAVALAIPLLLFAGAALAQRESGQYGAQVGAQHGGQRRVALVIGNDAYESSPLVNSVNDARAMATALREAGFVVLLHTDVDLRQFHLALREFGERLKTAGSGAAGLFYYAGHGVQIKGRNFLVPVRSQIAHEDEVAFAALDAQAVVEKMDTAGNGTNIVILDACRNNPFARSYRSGAQGLAQMDAPVGTLVAYATAPGAVATDSRPGLRNGLYTTHLLESVRRPGLKVEEVFKQVRNAVLRASGGRQQPWESTALVGDFYFHPPRDGGAPVVLAPAPAAPPTAPAFDAQAAIDDALWDAVKESRSSAELYAYLNRFPAGRHAREARRRLLDLAQPGGAGGAGGGGSTTTAPLPTLLGDFGDSAALAAPAASAALPTSPASGSAGAPSRPAEPQRNTSGFADGDRFRYRKVDERPGGRVSAYLWTIERIDADGSLWINGGRQRLDAQGQRLGGNDEQTGAWLELQPPLPIAELARAGGGIERDFATAVTLRDADGKTERAPLRGRVSTHAGSSWRGPGEKPELLQTIRVEVDLRGTSERSDGTRRELHWLHTYWIAPRYLLPVAFSLLETADGVLVQNTRHELLAIDQLSLGEPGPIVAQPPSARR